MVNYETVSRDSRAYRQGLVLGLTMAEVFLLLVFALLIALGTLWFAEHRKRLGLESKLEITNSTSSTADDRVLNSVRELVRSGKRNQVAEALGHIKEGASVEPLSPPEKQFIEEMREQLRPEESTKISDHWRTLTFAARNVADLDRGLSLTKAIDETVAGATTQRIKELIQTGLRVEQRGGHDWPPIINLSEANGYFFAKGRAELTPNFEQGLRGVVIPRLRSLAQEFAVDTIEVIGHTDEQPILTRFSNLDAFLLDVLNREGLVTSLVPADNAGLGLARAVSVVRALRVDGRLHAYSILPLSGGQLINTNDKTTEGGGGDAKERRRIEIRLRRSNRG
jgi:hypothetical protein